MAPATTFAFGPFRLDPVKRQLWKGQDEIKLRPTAFAVLRALVEKSGKIVTQEELLQQVWAETTVTKKALQVCITEIREVLGDNAAQPNYIQTVARKGYRFLVPLAATQLFGDSTPYLVGRDAEHDQLHTAFTQALGGQRQLVFVTGEPGIGKSTVVERFLGTLAEEGQVRVGRGQCLEQYGEGEAYFPVLEALSRLCREPWGAACMAALGQYAPSWMLQMPGLLSKGELVALQHKVQGTTRQRMLYELAEALEVLSTDHPIVLVFEDLHWSDHSTIELISYLAQRRELNRLLVIGTYRPVDVLTNSHPLRGMKQELQTHEQCQELQLGRLTEDDIAAYLSKRFPGGEQAPDLAGTIYQRTEGNALFMVNMANALLNQGVLVQTDQGWELRRAAETVRMPETLQQMIETRLEKLTAEQLQILETASLIGGEFAAAAVAAGIGQDAIAVEDVCTDLVRHGQFIELRGTAEWPDGTVSTHYGFLHALYREVLAGRVSVGRRVRLHQRIGERLEQAYRGQQHEIAGELAVHFEQGRDYARAVQYLQQAAETANYRCAYHEAIHHLRRGLQLLKQLPDTPERVERELMLQLSLGVSLMATKGYGDPEAKKAYNRAQKLCSQAGETAKLVPILRGLAAFYYVRGDLQTARGLAEDLLEQAQRLNDRALLVGAHHEIGGTLSSLGEFASALWHFNQGLTCYDSQKQSPYTTLYGNDPGVACFARACVALWFLGYPDQALASSAKAVALAEQLSHPNSLVYALFFAAIIAQFCGRIDSAQEQARTATRISAEHGFPVWGLAGTMLQGLVLAQKGQSKEGVVQIQDGIAGWKALGVEIELPSFLSLLVEAYRQEEQAQQGLSVLAEALERIDQSGERYYEAEIYRLRGELLLQTTQKKETEAEHCFQKAIDIARHQNAKSLELRAAMSLGRLWHQQGKRSEALRIIEEVYSWFTEGFDTKDLQEAKVLMRQLS